MLTKLSWCSPFQWTFSFSCRLMAVVTWGFNPKPDRTLYFSLNMKPQSETQGCKAHGLKPKQTFVSSYIYRNPRITHPSGNDPCWTLASKAKQTFLPLVQWWTEGYLVASDLLKATCLVVHIFGCVFSSPCFLINTQTKTLATAKSHQCKFSQSSVVETRPKQKTLSFKSYINKWLTESSNGTTHLFVFGPNLVRCAPDWDPGPAGFITIRQGL